MGALQTGPLVYLENSYSSGGVTVADPGFYMGGFCGEIDGEEIKDCFWDKNTSGKSSSYGGTDKTTSEMKTKSTF